jgi:hypothetical protein
MNMLDAEQRGAKDGECPTLGAQIIDHDGEMSCGYCWLWFAA